MAGTADTPAAAIRPLERRGQPPFFDTRVSDAGWAGGTLSAAIALPWRMQLSRYRCDAAAASPG